MSATLLTPLLALLFLLTTASPLLSPSPSPSSTSRGTCDVKALLGHAKGLRCDRLRAVLATSSSCASAKDGAGRTALHWIGGNAKIQDNTNDQEWKYLMGKSGFCTQIVLAFAGHDAIWMKDSSGMLPLHWAAANGMEEVASTLLLASLKGESTGGKWSIGGERSGNERSDQEREEEVRHRHVAMVEAREKTKGMTPLLVACAHNHLHLIKLLILNSANVDAYDGNGHTCLIKASVNGRADIVEYLLGTKARANPRMRDSDSKLMWSACHYAVFAGRKEIIELLLARESCDMKDAEGLTPYALAGIVPDREEIRNLLVNARIQSIQRDHKAWVGREDILQAGEEDEL